MLDPLLAHRQADQAAAMLGHEVDRIRGGKFRRDDEIAFIFAILRIDQDEHPAIAGILDDVLDGRKGDIAHARVSENSFRRAA